ncbi:MAG: type II secretion system protein [Planctomycetes bacterium]|nr:type II secretion system protein [Planctomycetota bacterium]
MSAPPTRTTGQQGWNTIELMIALAIVSVGLMVVVQQVSISFRETSSAEQRAFAYQRASAILHELQNAVATGEIANANDLVALADVTENAVLTTRRDAEGLLVAPDHRMSGNTLRQGHWLWSRRVEVAAREQSGLYDVRVSILRWDGQRWMFEANQTQLLSLEARADEPTQTFDVYALAIANAPALAGNLVEQKTALLNATAQLAQTSQARFRIHFIERLGYGRDTAHAPFVNVTKTAAQPVPNAYWLPSLLQTGDQPTWLYQSELLGGVHRTESGLTSGASTANPLPCTLADHQVHCLRAPAAEELFTARLAAGLEDEDAPPLQILLDRMHAEPERYRGAIFVNLHGNALPMPPLRNYADAAKDPAGRPGIRVVTHPARLRTARDPDGNGDHSDTQDVELRVHAYREPGASAAVLTEPILVQIFGVDLTSAVNTGATSTLTIARLPGGVDPNTGVAATPTALVTPAIAYHGFDSSGGVPDTTGGLPFAMRYEVGYSTNGGAHTWLKLYNTPLCAPTVDSRGLSASARLYGLEYNPSPISTGGTFAVDLATDSSDPHCQRNTARWRIRVPKRVFQNGLLPNLDQQLRIVTRIGADTTTGRRWPTPHQPANLSETWAWWSQAADAVPPTERAQFLGDPRLCPYADLMADGTTTPHGYNWNFDDLVAGAEDARPYYPCLDPTRLQSGCGERTRADAPRLLALLRSCLQATTATWVQPSGPIAEYLVLGGEITQSGGSLGLNPAGVSIDGTWFGSGGSITVDQIALPDGAVGGFALLTDPGTGWFARPWLGELVPDSGYQAWLTAGTTPAGCRWQNLDAVDLATFGTAALEPTGARLGTVGAALFLNHGPADATIAHELAAALTAPAAGVLAMVDAMNTNRLGSSPGMQPYTLNGSVAPESALARTDTYPRSTLTEIEMLWTSAAAGRHGGDLLRLSRGTDQTMFVVPTARTPSSAERLTTCVVALLHGTRAVHQAGVPTLPNRVWQQPALTLVEPEVGGELVNPATVTLRWRTAWTRFDGEPYTGEYPSGFTEDESVLRYRTMVSRDLGLTWTSIATGASAPIDVYPDDPGELLSDIAVGDESFTVALPSDSWPTGEYLFRVEAWRDGLRCHSAAHQIRVLIRRN